jgi:hypothetical protein
LDTWDVLQLVTEHNLINNAMNGCSITQLRSLLCDKRCVRRVGQLLFLLSVFICVINLGLTLINDMTQTNGNLPIHYRDDKKAVMTFLLNDKYNKSTGNTSTMSLSDRISC